jgi:hypothetical protein
LRKSPDLIGVCFPQSFSINSAFVKEVERYGNQPYGFAVLCSAPFSPVARQQPRPRPSQSTSGTPRCSLTRSPWRYIITGHGAAEKGTNINYLIPVDAKQPGTDAFWDESLKLDDVLRLLDGARSAAKFVIFDACPNERQLPTKDTSKGLLPVAEQEGLFVAYASSPGRTASDYGDKSGVYAAALAAELIRPGLDHLNLFENVKESVLASTNGVQQPWEVMLEQRYRRQHAAMIPGAYPCSNQISNSLRWGGSCAYQAISASSPVAWPGLISFPCPRGCSTLNRSCAVFPVHPALPADPA